MNYKIILIASLFLVVAVYCAEQENTKHETEVKEAKSEDDEFMNRQDEENEQEIMNFEQQKERLAELEDDIQQLKKSVYIHNISKCKSVLIFLGNKLLFSGLVLVGQNLKSIGKERTNIILPNN